MPFNSVLNTNQQNRDIKYVNRDFASLRNALIEYSKTYFPNTYSDFSENSPGMLFMEMASYVGDVLSFYQDNQIQENFIQYARQTNNLYLLAYMLGYTPKVTGVATVDVDFYQQVPAKLEGGQNVPDYDYALEIGADTQVASTLVNNTNFVMQDSIDFSFSSSLDPTEVSVYQISGDQPEYFLLKKTRKAISSTINTTTFTFGNVEKFPTVNISDTNIVGILDITDSDGNIWYEVPYLAQEMILDKIKNTNPWENDPNFSDDKADTPYLLRLKKVPRRFVTRFTSPTNLQIQFGAGTNTQNNDEEIIPNPNNVGLGLPFEQNNIKTAFSPSNFLFTDTYGIAPSNTTLTVRYLTGGGVLANIPSNTLSTIVTTNNIKFQKDALDATLAQYVFDSVEINNPSAATGGQDGDTIQELRFNSLAAFNAQQRTVTQDDYLVRALSMPSDFGSIAKVYVEPEKLENLNPGEIPAVLDLYVLAYNNDKKLTTASNALKRNLNTYLSQYRVINDSVRIKDAFIINIGVEFEIITLPNYNSNQVLLRCITALQNYFNIDKWQINQPILLRDLFITLDRIEGVQTVNKVDIINKVGISLGYSQYAYDIKAATQNNVIYPSLDASIFEVKNPNIDIKGRVSSF
jgi:hypothetical protein